jgi:hypothetical protein
VCVCAHACTHTHTHSILRLLRWLFSLLQKKKSKFKMSIARLFRRLKSVCFVHIDTMYIRLFSVQNFVTASPKICSTMLLFYLLITMNFCLVKCNLKPRDRDCDLKDNETEIEHTMGMSCSM